MGEARIQFAIPQRYPDGLRRPDAIADVVAGGGANGVQHEEERKVSKTNVFSINSRHT